MAQSVATARIGSFHFISARAILAKCLGTAYPRTTAQHLANCRPIFMSCRVRGRPVKHDVESWRVIDGWPARVPIANDEIDVFEASFADLFDEILGLSR